MKDKHILIGLLAALLLALAVSPFASNFPDGLEKIAEDKGFLEKGEIEPKISSPMPDYCCPVVKNERLSTSLAGVLGTFAVFAIGYVIAGLIKKN